MSQKATASATANAGGVGFAGLLTILFIALKLTGVIDWDWIWVLSPLWIMFGIVCLVFLIFGSLILILSRK